MMMGEALQPNSPISENPRDWRSVPGYEGRYQCDRFGRVRSLVRGRKPRLLKQFKRDKGVSRGQAVYVKLTDSNGKARDELVGRLIWETWKGPVKHFIYHKNGMQHDNSLDNLADLPRSEIARRTGGKARAKSVAQFDEKGNCTAFYKSAREAGRKNYISYQTVLDRCNGEKFKKGNEYIGGYTYRWADEIGR